jgi:hypothetical protein
MKRIVVTLTVILLMPVAAVAQEWKAYTYPDPGFSIQFPGTPVVETGSTKNATGMALPVTRYLVRQDHIIYTLSVANYSSINADAMTTIVETQRSLGASGKVTGATGARIGRNFGRILSLEGTDGSRSAVAIFFVDKHLYTAVGKALPPNANEESDDATRFLESLQFPDDNGGFLRFFGGGGGGGGLASGTGGGSSSNGTSSSSSKNNAGVTGAVGPGSGSSGSPRGTAAGGGRPRSTNNPPADAACTGKSAGDAVQLDTPGGPVAATCTLVARPNSAGPAH